jgi:hypothetical protein
MVGITATMILDFLRKRPGRYIQHDTGHYRMKEANGVDVIESDDRGVFHVDPSQAQIDGLMEEAKLIQNGSRYIDA